MMSLSIFLLWLVSIPISIHALPAARGFHLNCGASENIKDGSFTWAVDEGFISVGNKTILDGVDLMPFLQTLRFFPDEKARKYCYMIPVTKGARYIVRTTYYYGGFDGGKEPPVFDQIVEGTKWSTVNTSENYANGLTSYFEIAVAAKGKKLSVCLARNKDTTSSPFMSALELEHLEDSMYNSTDFNKYALSTIARNRFGYEGELMRYPDDPFNRYWEPFKDENPVVVSHINVTWTDFWNLPPLRAYETGITTSRGKSLQLKWPAMMLPNASYYIALYFQDNRTPSPYSWRMFNVSVNGKNFYKKLNVSTAGVTVSGSKWPLSGQTEIILTPDDESPVGPIINAGEIFLVMPLSGRTLTRDVSVMEEVARVLKHPPADWSGDPCHPKENSWTGVTCSHGQFARIVSLNLTNFGVSGSLSPSISNLTAVTDIWLGGNNLSGSIPDLSALKQLASLHLEDNELSGKIPESLGKLNNLRDLSLQNNKLEGDIPDTLKSRKGLHAQI